jgi:hypothetical protein
MTNCKVKNEIIRLLNLCRDRPEQFNKLILKRPPYRSRQIDLCRSVVEYRTTVETEIRFQFIILLLARKFGFSSSFFFLPAEQNKDAASINN